MLRIKTVQALAFRNLFENIRDVLSECCMVSTPAGVRITAVDVARVCLTDVRLHASNFEEYVCTESVVTSGLNIHHLTKLLKSVGAHDTLEIRQDDTCTMSIAIEHRGGSNTRFSLKLIDIDDEGVEPAPLNKVTTTTMPSAEFQKFMRDMASIGATVTMERARNTLTFSTVGDFATQESVRETLDVMDDGVRHRGTYCLKYINTFTKAANICPTVQLIHTAAAADEEEDAPLIMAYAVANLGDLTFFLANKVD